MDAAESLRRPLATLRRPRTDGEEASLRALQEALQAGTNALARWTTVRTAEEQTRDAIRAGIAHAYTWFEEIKHTAEALAAALPHGPEAATDLLAMIARRKPSLPMTLRTLERTLTSLALWTPRVSPPPDLADLHARGAEALRALKALDVEAARHARAHRKAAAQLAVATRLLRKLTQP
jgi:hypothetical protein